MWTPAGIAAAAMLASWVGSTSPVPQVPARDQALVRYREGFTHMQAEAFDDAAVAFEAATGIDPTFEMAHYMLGRANMARKRYLEAITALTESRRLYQRQFGSRFSNAQEAQRYRRDTIAEIDEYIRQLQSGRQTQQTIEQIRQLNERKRQLLEFVNRGTNMTIEIAVPAYVSLSLGSAHFRAGHLAEAEQAYLEAVAADSAAGEAYNNLAVVYLETGRPDEAEKAVKAAEKAGLRVNPALKDEIKKRKVRGSL